MRLHELTQPLMEYRKNPDSNRKTGVVDTLLEYAKKGEGYHVTFSTLDMVTINPASDWTTPNGIYCYPLWMFADRLRDEIYHSEFPHIDNVFPYATDRGNVYILKDKGDISYISSDLGTTIDVDEYIEMMKRCFIECYGRVASLSYEVRDLMPDIISEHEVNGETAVDYACIQMILGKQHSYAETNRTNMFNRLLRHLGYSAICDLGTGTIHRNEPTQTVFLLPSSYTVVDRMTNTFKNSTDALRRRTNRDELSIVDGVYDGNLMLANRKNIHSLPSKLRVINGNVNLRGSSIRRLPDGLTVMKDLDLSNSGIQVLPKNLVVKGDLMLDGTGIKTFPTDIVCSGSILMRDTEISHLPDNMHVNGLLDTPKGLLELPPKLTVNKALYISSPYIDDIKTSLYVGRDLFVNRKLYVKFNDGTLTKVPSGVQELVWLF